MDLILTIVHSAIYPIRIESRILQLINVLANPEQLMLEK